MLFCYENMTNGMVCGRETVILVVARVFCVFVCMWPVLPRGYGGSMKNKRYANCLLCASPSLIYMLCPAIP